METSGRFFQILSDFIYFNYSARYSTHKEETFLGENHLWEVRSRKDEEGADFSLRKR